MSSIDIVVIHKGYNKYLYYSLLETKKNNPSSIIHLLTDIKNNNKLKNIANIIDINSLESDKSLLFEKSYKHLGKSNPYFEMFCIKRWFILKNFMKKYNIEKCFHIDSDVILFQNMNNYIDHLSSFDIALASKLALTMFVKNIKTLDGFCDFVLDKYTNDNSFKTLESMYYSGRHLNGVAGSISDMDLSREYFSSVNFKIGDLCEVYNESIFDSAIVYGEPNFEMTVKGKYKMKKISFENDILHCIYNSKKIKLNSIHFIVWSKIYMKKLIEHKNLNFNPIYINLFREFSTLKKKILKK